MGKQETGAATGKAAVSEKLDARLRAYGITAAAAGVGLLALAQSAQAEVIYTPAHVLFSTTASRSIDLTHDGTNEFRFVDGANLGSGSITFAFVVGRHAGDGVLARPSCCGSASPLAFGAKIGHSGNFYDSAVMAAAYAGTGGGTWGKNRYLGLKFNLNGQEHYGWAELSIELNKRGTLTVLIEGYAYETTANKPIFAGETQAGQAKEQDAALLQSAPAFHRDPVPATLGLLALGSPGLSIWRRETNQSLSKGSSER